jgi:hypothetical protein
VRCGAALKEIKYLTKEIDPSFLMLGVCPWSFVCCIVPYDPNSVQEFLEVSTCAE